MTKAIHPVDQKLPWGRTLIYAAQHVLAMYAGAVAVPLVLAGAIGLSTEQLIYLINADLFTCGIATLVQALSIKNFIGSKLPIVQGCTFTAVTPMIIIANTHGGGAAGLQVVYGSAILDAAVLPAGRHWLGHYDYRTVAAAGSCQLDYRAESAGRRLLQSVKYCVVAGRARYYSIYLPYLQGISRSYFGVVGLGDWYRHGGSFRHGRFSCG